MRRFVTENCDILLLLILFTLACYLSRKAQTALQKDMAKVADSPDSLRIDIPKDDVSSNNRRVDGVSYSSPFDRPGRQPLYDAPLKGQR